MKHEATAHVDYGTGQKQFGTYVLGTLACVVLTILAFWVVMAQFFGRWETLIIIYAAAVLQFFIQLICFLRLHWQTLQAKLNVMAFIFTGVILTSIVVGSLWIMFNLDYNMTH